MSTEDLDDLRAKKLRREISLLGVQYAAEKAEFDRIQFSPIVAHSYHYYSDFSYSSVAACLDELSRWHREDPTCDIEIIFTSPGGSVLDGLALYDYIRFLSGEGHHITTRVLGMALSMGGILLQAGDLRVASPRSYMMIHELQGQAGGSTSSIADAKKLMDRLSGDALEILAEKSEFTTDEIKEKWERRDWWLNADEMLEAGFVDEIQ